MTVTAKVEYYTLARENGLSGNGQRCSAVCLAFSPGRPINSSHRFEPNPQRRDLDTAFPSALPAGLLEGRAARYGVPNGFHRELHTEG
jgi:hypothetical protein